MNNSMLPTSGPPLIALAIGLLCIGLFALWQWQKSKRPKAEEAEEEIKPLRGKQGKQVAVAKKEKVVLLPKYPSMVFSDMGIVFQKIPYKIGNVCYLEPSMPEHGARLLVLENEQGGFEAYDPREAPMLSDETPQKAYRAINWDVVKRVFAYHYGVWEKINQILIGVIVLGAFFLAIVAIDKLGK